MSLLAHLFKDLNDLGDHPDDEEFDDSASAAATEETLSELSDGTVPYEPKAESLMDKKLHRIAEQMLAGLAQVSASKNVDSEPKVPEKPEPDVSEKKPKDLVAMGDQLKIMMEKAQRLHDSKRDTRPLPLQELPAHVAWIFLHNCSLICVHACCTSYVSVL